MALKKRGIDIEYTVEVPLIAFCGDTAEGAWMERQSVRQAKILILECTFFEADHIRRARAGYHLHVRDVARILEKLENQHVVLSHITRRTGIREARLALSRMLSKETLSRVTLLMDRKNTRPRRDSPRPRGP